MTVNEAIARLQELEKEGLGETEFYVAVARVDDYGEMVTDVGRDVSVTLDDMDEDLGRRVVAVSFEKREEYISRGEGEFSDWEVVEL